jgi:Fe-S cluster assembly protein SufD
MSVQIPVRLGPAELALIEQLTAAGASSDAERLATVGLPTRKVEAYHYTDLKQLWRDVPPLAAAGATAGAGAVTLAIPGAFVVSIVNGTVLTAGEAPKGVFVGTTEGSAIKTRDDILTRMNIALVKEALRLQVDAGVEVTIHIDRRIEGEASHALSAAGIFVADGANVTIVETYGTSDAAHVANHSTFLSVGRNATVTFVTADLGAATARTFAEHEVEIGENSRVRTLAVQVGSALSRTTIEATLREQGAHADFTGLNLSGEGQHHDITLGVTHAVAHTSSQPLHKQIGRGRSKSVFQGRILVQRDAQKTDAKMMMQGLMLSDEAEILSKPELEIYADDVVCGHGSTCGDLDETSLFYLMSRGIPKDVAEAMLVRAFLAELVDPVMHHGTRDALTGVIEGWLAKSE